MSKQIGKLVGVDFERSELDVDWNRSSPISDEQKACIRVSKSLFTWQQYCPRYCIEAIVYFPLANLYRETLLQYLKNINCKNGLKIWESCLKDRKRDSERLTNPQELKECKFYFMNKITTMKIVYAFHKNEDRFIIDSYDRKVLYFRTRLYVYNCFDMLIYRHLCIKINWIFFLVTGENWPHSRLARSRISQFN